MRATCGAVSEQEEEKRRTTVRATCGVVSEQEEEKKNNYGESYMWCS